MVQPRPPTAIEAVTRGCMALGIIGISQFVAGASMCFVLVMAYVMQTRLTNVLEEKEARMTTVPVLAHTMGPGTVIGSSDLVDQRIDASFVPKKAIRDRRELLGRTLRERTLGSEFLRAERLAPLGPSQGFTAIIAPNTRIISLDLLQDERVAGFVEPGNLVDLLVTLPDDADRVAETVTVAEAVRVLAVDERTTTTAQEVVIRIPQVTVAIPLEYANQVIHALSIGKPKLVLRSEIDFHRRDSNGAVSNELIGTNTARMTVAEFRAAFSEEDVDEWIEILYGDHSIRQQVIDPALLRGIDGPPVK